MGAAFFVFLCFFFFQAEDGIRDLTVTGVQTCALPISPQDLALLSCDSLCLRDRQRHSFFSCSHFRCSPPFGRQPSHKTISPTGLFRSSSFIAGSGLIFITPSITRLGSEPPPRLRTGAPDQRCTPCRMRNPCSRLRNSSSGTRPLLTTSRITPPRTCSFRASSSS